MQASLSESTNLNIPSLS